MINKIKNFYNNVNWQHLQDIRVYGLFVFLIIVLLMTWSGVKAIQSNYGLEKQISQLQQEVQVQHLENNNLALNNTYFQTNQYLELSARQNFGLAAPGETEIIVPEAVALSHVSNTTATSSTTSSTINSKQPLWQKNFQAWINFFLNRQNPTD